MNRISYILAATAMTFGLVACDDTVKTQSTVESKTEMPGQPDATAKSEVTVVVPETAASGVVEQKREVTVEQQNADGSKTETTKKIEVSK